MRIYIRRPEVREKRRTYNRKHRKARLKISKELSRRYQTESEPAESFTEFRRRISRAMNNDQQ